MSGRVFVPYHRQGTAEGATYTAVIAPAADGWRWGGHCAVTEAGVTDFGPQIAGDGPFETREQAAAFADEWFYSIDGIVEKTTVQRPASTITTNDFPSAGGIIEKSKTKKKRK